MPTASWLKRSPVGFLEFLGHFDADSWVGLLSHALGATNCIRSINKNIANIWWEIHRTFRRSFISLWKKRKKWLSNYNRADLQSIKLSEQIPSISLFHPCCRSVFAIRNLYGSLKYLVQEYIYPLLNLLFFWTSCFLWGIFRHSLGLIHIWNRFSSMIEVQYVYVYDPLSCYLIPQFVKHNTFHSLHDKAKVFLMLLTAL